jgi:hypothetical protein
MLTRQDEGCRENLLVFSQPLPQRHSFISPPLNSPLRTSPSRASVLYTRNQAKQCEIRMAKAKMKMMDPIAINTACQSARPDLGTLLGSFLAVSLGLSWAGPLTTPSGVISCTGLGASLDAFDGTTCDCDSAGPESGCLWEVLGSSLNSAGSVLSSV